MNATETIRSMAAIDIEAVTDTEESVYFVESAGLVKVGWSKNPRARILGLTNSAGAQLRVLAVAEGTRSREQHLHALLERSRHHGEWFRPSGALVAWIHAALSGSLIWRTLPNGTERLPAGFVARPLTEKEQHRREVTHATLRLLDESYEVAERAREEFLAKHGLTPSGLPLPPAPVFPPSTRTTARQRNPGKSMSAASRALPSLLTAEVSS